MNDLEKIQSEMAFYAEVGPIMEELEAARLVKGEDPERWKAAVAAMDGDDNQPGVRTYYRQIAEYVNAVTLAEVDEANTSITVATVDGDSETISPVKGM